MPLAPPDWLLLWVANHLQSVIDLKAECDTALDLEPVGGWIKSLRTTVQLHWKKIFFAIYSCLLSSRPSRTFKHPACLLGFIDCIWVHPPPKYLSKRSTLSVEQQPYWHCYFCPFMSLILGSPLWSVYLRQKSPSKVGMQASSGVDDHLESRWMLGQDWAKSQRLPQRLQFSG